MNQSPTRKPPEAAYIPQARRVVTAQMLKNRAAEEELNAKRAAATAMHSVNVREFDFTVDGEEYHAELKRPEVEVVSPQKLYVLVKEGELALDDFLECVTVNETAVAELLGENRLPGLKELRRKGLNLVITNK
jgi:hypothetical protein